MFSSLWKAIKAIVKKIFDFIKKFLKKFWVVIAVIAVFWFAPAITGFLASSGAPGWLTSAFSWTSTTITPTVTSVGGWLSSGAGKLGGWLKAGWASLTFGQKATLAVGAAGLLAPEETGQLLADVAGAVGDVVGGGVSAVVNAATKSPLFLVAAGLAVWYFFLREDPDEVRPG